MSTSKDNDELYSRFTNDVLHMIIFAKAASIDAGLDTLYPESLLVGTLITGGNEVTKTLKSHGVDVLGLLDAFKKQLSDKRKESSGDGTHYDELKVGSVLGIFKEAGADESKVVDLKSIFVAAIENDEESYRLFLDTFPNHKRFVECMDELSKETETIKKIVRQLEEKHMVENNLESYVINATRTESRVDDEFGMNSRVLHALMGLTTETGEIMDALKRHVFYVKEDGSRKELDSVNLCEEVGDLMWYMAILCDHYGIDFKRSVEVFSDDRFWERRLDKISIFGLFDSLVEFQLEVASQMRMCYGGERSGGAHPNIPRLFTQFNRLVFHMPMSWEELAAQNIEKLRARFPEKYECGKAYDRDLPTERDVLEGK
jgi:NTP pyrophosphatase (non-canonical NTP hydrolase)